MEALDRKCQNHHPDRPHRNEDLLHEDPSGPQALRPNQSLSARPPPRDQDPTGRQPQRKYQLSSAPQPPRYQDPAGRQPNRPIQPLPARLPPWDQNPVGQKTQRNYQQFLARQPRCPAARDYRLSMPKLPFIYLRTKRYWCVSFNKQGCNMIYIQQRKSFAFTVNVQL